MIKPFSGQELIARVATQIERREAEFASVRLGAIVESSDDAIVSKDLDGIITSWNPAAERIFGYSAEEAVGRSIRLIIPADRQSEEDEVLRRVRAGEFVKHFETVRQRKDGSFVDISLTVSPIKGHSGEIVGASKIARDISERKAAEAAREELVEQLTVATAAAERSSAHYRDIFQSAAVSIWEEDFSSVKQRVDELTSQGVDDIRSYLESHPEVVEELVSLVKDRRYQRRGSPDH